VYGRDPYWYYKHKEGKEKGMEWGETPEALEMPKSSPEGLAIAVCAGVFGFGMVWHIWWLAGLGLAAAIIAVIARSFESETEEPISL
jgi:cytochrome o ubiquinol oxidase subunit 1